jgi:hypothetical protein
LPQVQEHRVDTRRCRVPPFSLHDDDDIVRPPHDDHDEDDHNKATRDRITTE